MLIGKLGRQRWLSSYTILQAQVQNRNGRPFVASYELDKLGNKHPLNIPSANKTFSGTSTLERDASSGERHECQCPQQPQGKSGFGAGIRVLQEGKLSTLLLHTLPLMTVQCIGMLLAGLYTCRGGFTFAEASVLVITTNDSSSWINE